MVLTINKKIKMSKEETDKFLSVFFSKMMLSIAVKSQNKSNKTLDKYKIENKLSSLSIINLIDVFNITFGIESVFF